MKTTKLLIGSFKASKETDNCSPYLQVVYLSILKSDWPNRIKATAKTYTFIHLWQHHNN